MDNRVTEIALAKIDNNLLDQAIEWMIDKKERDDHLICWLIQAKQYRNLELEFL